MVKSQEFSILTTQHLPMFSIFVLGEKMAQVIGSSGEYTLCKYIKWDNSATLVELKDNSISDYIEEM